MVHAINAICVVASGCYAIYCFNRGNKVFGWFNVFASALNLAALLHWLSI